MLIDHVSLRELFVAFFKISARAWGGGSGTIFTMHQDLVKLGWITSAQFTLDFGLARLVPGINLLAVAIMVGYRLNGLAGATVAISALMLPASVITLILTIGFVGLTSHPLGVAAVQGAVPVTAALTFALALENANGSRPTGETRVTILMASYAVLTFAVIAFFQISVVFPIILGGFLGAFLFRPPEVAPK